MTRDNGKDGQMDHLSGRISGFHDPNQGGLYGTHEGDSKEGSHAPDFGVRKERSLDRMNRDDMEEIRRQLARQGMSEAEISQWYGKL